MWSNKEHKSQIYSSQVKAVIKNRIYLPCAVSCFISNKDRQEMGPVSVYYDPFNSTLSSFVLRSWPHSPSGRFAWGCKFPLEMAKPKVSSTEAIKRITNNLLQCLFYLRLLFVALTSCSIYCQTLLSLVQSRADWAALSLAWKRIEIQSDAYWMVQILDVPLFTSKLLATADNWDLLCVITCNFRCLV